MHTRPFSCLMSCLSALALCACATPAPPQVPPPLQPGEAYAQAFTLLGKGVQIYRCELAAGAPKWVFVAPRAQLFEPSGATAGTHGAGPFWQAGDGSRIVGKALQNVPAPNAQSIPWLLLSTTSDGSPGRFAPVGRVQRLDTVGGVAPASGCDTAADQGQQAESPYSASYVFFVAR